MEAYGIPEAAQLLGLSLPVVRSMIEEGELEARQVEGRWRVTGYAVERARVRLQPGPRPVGDGDRLAREDIPGGVEARLATVERRLDRLEGALPEPAGAPRHVLARPIGAVPR